MFCVTLAPRSSSKVKKRVFAMVSCIDNRLQFSLQFRLSDRTIRGTHFGVIFNKKHVKCHKMNVIISLALYNRVKGFTCWISFTLVVSFIYC